MWARPSGDVSTSPPRPMDVMLWCRSNLVAQARSLSDHLVRAMGSRILGHALVILLIAGCTAAPPVGAADRPPTGMAGPGYHKDGGVAGTTTWVEHDPKGVDGVLLFNASKGKPKGPELHQEYQHEMRGAISATTTWPDVDLFGRYR